MGGIFNFLPLKRWGGGLLEGGGLFERVGLIEDLRYYSKSFDSFLLGRRHEFEAQGTGRVFDQLNLNLTGHFVHTGLFNIFALFSRKL